MARHTFVTESHTFGDEKKTVDILSRAEVRSIVDDGTVGLAERIDEINDDKQKIWDILDQFKQKPPHGTKNAYERAVREFRDAALGSAKDAAVARELVEQLVETARETFRDVIEELLAPHYRRLAALAAAAGIEVPEEATEQKKPTKEQSAVARNTPPPASGGSPLSEGATKKGRASGTSTLSRTKKSTVAKKTAASSRTKSKGARSCRKK